MMRQRLTLFVYKPRAGKRSYTRIRRWLFGVEESRYSTRLRARKIYRYSGALSGIWYSHPHAGVLIVESTHEAAVIDLFKKYRVPFVRAAVKEINIPEKLGAV